MIPVTRIDMYLATISGDEDAVTPLPDPITRIDHYLANLAGMEVAELPEPVTRIDCYLAALCGMDVVLPDEPLTRIDFYLAALNGETVETPEAITRIDYYLSKWAEGGGGLPWETFVGNPLLFTAPKAHTLRSAVVEFAPKQAGSGDPSPDNVRPISGWTGLDIYGTGENLIPSNDASGRTYAGITFAVNSDGSITVTGTATASSWWKGATSISDWHFIKAGTYKMKGGISSNKILYIIGQFVDGTVVNNASVTGGIYDRGSGLTFTLPQDAYIAYQIQIVNGTECNDTFYPIISVDDAEYHPYTGSTTTLTFPTTVYGGTATVAEDGTAIGSGMYGIVDLGTLIWSITTSSGGVQMFIGYPTGIDTGVIGTDNLLCERYKHMPCINASIATDSNLPNNSVLQSSGGQSIRIRDDSFSDPAVFKTAMSGTKLSYKLATPTPFTPVASATPTAVQGINTMWTDGDTLTVEARGEAVNLNALQSLNMLLGGRYVNNHTPEDLTDEEALDIILNGGNR